MKKNTFITSNFLYLTMFLLVVGAFSACISTQEVTKQDSAGSTPLTATLASLKSELAPVKHIRYNVYSKKGQENLKIMQRGMKIMKSMDCSQPYSWYFQGGIHGAPTTNTNDICPTFYLEGTKGWNNCTHGDNQKGDGVKPKPTTKSGQFHFLSWHKLYLDHFEEAIRAVANEPNFTVPYWEYDARDLKNRAAPNSLQKSTTSLYEPCRNQDINSGKPIPQIVSGTGSNWINGKDVTDTKAAFTNNSTFYTFTGGLESVPHDMMHVYLGLQINKGICPKNRLTNEDDGLMLDPTTAGMDPVFWIHHANIDRLFEKWLIINVDSPEKVRPTFSQFKDNHWNYRFYTGNTVNDLKIYTNEEVYRAAYGIKEYSYQTFIEDGSYNTEYTQKTKAAVEAALQPRLTGTVLFSHLPIILASNEDNTNAEKDNLAEINLIVNTNFESVNFAKEETTAWLVEVDVEFAEEPKATFDVSVEHNGQIESIGTMTFFGAGHRHGEDAGNHENHTIFEKQFTFELRDKHLMDLPSDLKIIVEQNGNWGDGIEQITIDRVEIQRLSIVR